MQFIQRTNRHQTWFATLNDQVFADNPAGLMDAFIGDKIKCIKHQHTKNRNDERNSNNKLAILPAGFGQRGVEQKAPIRPFLLQLFLGGF